MQEVYTAWRTWTSCGEIDLLDMLSTLSISEILPEDMSTMRKCNRINRAAQTGPIAAAVGRTVKLLDMSTMGKAREVLKPRPNVEGAWCL